MVIKWVLLFVAFLIVGGCWLLVRNDRRNNKPQQQSTVEEEHYRLGREHALAGEKASLATEAYKDGFSDGLKQRKS
ncbi:hypothetical protein [Aeromonas caviae]|uniref:Uncharacterized protein n=1 Tax=Aeromonas caviae TaxID=648 RepID=A0AAJ6CS43_AERCA|nr:hypothetical protein [Aeromonas caviae]WFG00148.1 hypothetical protein P5S46_21885 [Aeromonas caviae]